MAAEKITMRKHWLLLLLTAPFVLLAQTDEGFIRLQPGEIAWSTPDPESGVSRVVLAGDPSSDGFYLMRVRFPAGFFTSPHYHPNDRHVTVISGTWYTGTGTAVDRDAMVPLGPGSYMLHPAGAIHYDGVKNGEVVVEIKGIGPGTVIPAGQ